MKIKQLSNKTKIKLIFGSFMLLNIFVFSIIYTFFLSDKPYNTASVKAEEKSLERATYLKNYFEHSSSLLSALSCSESFIQYVKGDENKKQNIISNMKILINSQSSIIQFRYLDKDGFEKIRIEHKNGKVKVIDEKKLQDKSLRDYFIQSKMKEKSKIFFSNIDLNIERGKVEIPYQPTIRGILPIIVNKKFQGILVVNFSMELLLNSFFNSEFFNMILIDTEGYTLAHYDKTKSWGRYTSPQVHIKDIFPDRYNEILNNDMIKNTEIVSNKLNLPMINKPILILQIKDKWIIELKQKYYNQLITFFIVMIILSFLIAIAIYKIVNKLNLDLLERYNYEKIINEYVEVIDKNVITSQTDLKGTITYTSEAFCKISGYSKKELIGNQHNIIRHKDVDSKLYEDLWKTIKSNKNWEGEIKNKHKNGDTYWVHAHITPIYNNNKQKIGYMSVRQDITDKKELERISTIDALSDIYNKRFFYMVTPKYIQSAQRYNSIVCFVLIDIDNFKLYNDTYGHLAGDLVIKNISKIFKEKMERADDFSFRVGGEEFALLFKTDDILKSIQFVTSIKKSIESLHIEHKKNTVSKYVTVSMGMICKNALEIKSVDEIYKQADDLLYKAKANGRNILETNKS